MDFNSKYYWIIERKCLYYSLSFYFRNIENLEYTYTYNYDDAKKYNTYEEAKKDEKNLIDYYINDKEYSFIIKRIKNEFYIFPQKINRFELMDI